MKSYFKREITKMWSLYIVAERDKVTGVSKYIGILANEQASHAIPLKVEWEVHGQRADEDKFIIDSHVSELLLNQFLHDILFGHIAVPEATSDTVDKLLFEAQDYFRFQESAKDFLKESE